MIDLTRYGSKSDKAGVIRTLVLYHYVERMIGILEEQMQNGGNLADKLDTFNREIFPELGDAGWAKQVDLGDDYDIDGNYPLNE